ncbi:MAG: hypothetical protein WCF45_10450 [Photobacterium halotolerans]
MAMLTVAALIAVYLYGYVQLKLADKGTEGYLLIGFAFVFYGGIGWLIS